MIRQIGESAARAVVHTAIRQSPTVYVAGANGGGNDIRRWKAVKDFWIGYFERAGARLGGYSILSTAPFLAHSNLTIAAARAPAGRQYRTGPEFRAIGRADHCIGSPGQRDGHAGCGHARRPARQ